jgi:hypothetical protein
MAGDPSDSFQTDGQLYLFSTLRPEPPPDGVLKLVTMDDDWLNGLVFAVVVLAGVLLLRAKATTRLLAIGALIVALVLAGVFLPTFALQLLDGVSLAAVLLVLLGWLVMYLAWTRPRDPDVQARREARQKVRMARIYAQLPQTAPPSAPKPPPAGKESVAAEKPEQPTGDSKPADADQADEEKGGQQDD